MNRIISILITFFTALAVFHACASKEKDIQVTAITIAPSSVQMTVGETVQLTATVSPSNASGQNVTWSSSDISIATVDAGKVTAVKEGEAVIQAKAGDKTAECKVSVTAKKIDLRMVLLNKTELSLNVGEAFTLTTTLVPENATVQTILWSTSDPGVATVEDGHVKALKEGSANVLVSVDGKTAKCAVTVNYISVRSITLDKTSVILYEGEDATLSASIKPENATYKDITWTSSDPQIATVEDGKVHAIKKGSTTIKAEANGKSALCQVDVLSSLTEISLSKSELSMGIGETEKLTVILSPKDATLREGITWSSTDESIASVDDNGTVTAIKEGTATISASVEGKKAECKVVVDYIHVSSIEISKREATLYIGEALTLTATLKPSNASYPTIEWASSDEAVVSVNGNGYVRAVGKGEATVTARSDGKEARCHFTVLVPLTGLSFDQSSLTLDAGANATLSLIKTPSDATLRGDIIWKSSDTAVATITSDGLVTAMSPGSATITASVDGCTATCIVTVPVPVPEPDPDPTPVSSITLNQGSLKLKQNETAQLVATVGPEDASDKTVRWSSSNTAIATVDSTGMVKALKEGSCVISAKAGDKTATCSVTVSNAVSGGIEGTGEEDWN